MDSRPVGIFDSGMGGISLLRDAVRLLPHENFIYYGDNANAPYGDRSEKEILQLTSNSADFLLDHGVKALVIACNTATGISIKDICKFDTAIVSLPVFSCDIAIPDCVVYGFHFFRLGSIRAGQRKKTYPKSTQTLRISLVISCRAVKQTLQVCRPCSAERRLLP